MFTFQNIYKAYLACRRNKRNTINALKFEQNLIENLWKIHDELNSKRYNIGKSLCFLTTSPKLREVFASDFKDRVVHHILVGQLEPLFERKFIHDVYNNRKAKGTHQAVSQAQRYMRQTADGYYLQLDIKGFFYNLEKMILLDKIKQEVIGSNLDVSSVLYLSNKIIFHDPTKSYYFKGDKSKLALLPPHKTLFKIPKNRGLPIGNLTSQFFANVYMNDFDNFVKRTLKVKRYIRYVDDFVLFDESKERLTYLKSEIEEYLQKELKLTLREDTKLKKHSEGLDFLGYIIRPTYTLVRQRVVNNFKKKKAKYLNAYENQKGNMRLLEIKQFLSVKASFVGHCKHANSYNLNQKVGVLNETNPFDYARA
ncbi:MAG: Retron-type reverse transcriptase [uncultured Sulfurovum sp.]|uniref:Retron-type reverse transcriptase n=1 Tax=uncultured Sulfurovum sp. TaxID=269237 RepID=A0A6S6U890_9BACT|nr:MAG: Retron-type reverse transcriptase [uncultured Sulfurovum sp.]